MTKQRRTYESPQEYLEAYKSLAREQREFWARQGRDMTQEMLEIQGRHLDMILIAPKILTTSEQRVEEEYLRRNMLDAREEMLRIRLSERYAKSTRPK